MFRLNKIFERARFLRSSHNSNIANYGESYHNYFENLEQRNASPNIRDGELRTLDLEVRAARFGGKLPPKSCLTLAPPPPDDGSSRLVHLLHRQRLTEFLEIAEILGYTGEDGLQLLTSLQIIAAWEVAA